MDSTDVWLVVGGVVTPLPRQATHLWRRFLECREAVEFEALDYKVGR